MLFGGGRILSKIYKWSNLLVKIKASHHLTGWQDIVFFFVMIHNLSHWLRYALGSTQFFYGASPEAFAGLRPDQKPGKLAPAAGNLSLQAGTLCALIMGVPLAVGFACLFVLLAQHRAQNMEDSTCTHWGLQALHL